MDLPQRGHVEDDAVLDERLPVNGMGASADRDAEIVPACEPQDASQVANRSRLQHGHRPLLHEAAEVDRRGVARGVVERQHAVEWRQRLDVHDALRMDVRDPLSAERAEAQDDRAGGQAPDEGSSRMPFHRHHSAFFM